jgi:hypothetical protein
LLCRGKASLDGLSRQRSRQRAPRHPAVAAAPLSSESERPCTFLNTIGRVPSHQTATAHELARIAELAGLPGETLGRLGEQMERRGLDLGEKLDATGHFGVVLTGMLRGGPGLLRPGDTFEGPVTAITLATVATCERAAYESLIA